MSERSSGLARPLKCELCPRMALDNDILCLVCGRMIDAGMPASEILRPLIFELNSSSGTYSPALAAKVGGHK